MIDKLPILDKIAAADDGIGRMFQLVKVISCVLICDLYSIFRVIQQKHLVASSWLSIQMKRTNISQI